MNSNGVITTPVSINADVYPVLGIGAQGGFYDVGYVCSNVHKRINMWSRMKPVHIENALTVDRSTQWWRGTRRDCGISLTNAKVNNVNYIVGKYTEDKINGWAYEAPWGDRGGIVTSPYRLDDFINYKHDANPPIYNFSGTPKVSQYGTLYCSVAMGITDNPEGGKNEPGSVGLDDIEAGITDSVGNPMKLSDMYLGIVVTDTSNKVLGRSTATSPGSQLNVAYEIRGLPHGNYYAYPFLSSVIIGQSDADMMGTYITLPNVSKHSFKVTSQEEVDGIHITFTANYTYLTNGTTKTKTGIAYSLIITTDHGWTFHNNHIQMRFSTSAVSDALQAGEVDIKLDEPIAVGSNGDEYRKIGRFDISPAYASHSFYLYLTLDAAKYTRKIDPLQEVTT